MTRGGIIVLAAGGGVAPTPVQFKVNQAIGGSTTKAITFDSSVTNGNLIVVGVGGFLSNRNDVTLTAAMLTKTAGTSTVGTVQIDRESGRTDTDDDNPIAIFSVPVTGSGTLTLTLDISSIAGDSNFWMIGGVEYSGADVSGTRVNASNSANTSTNTTVSSGNVATGGAGIIFGVMVPGNPYGAITNTPDGAFTEYETDEDDDPVNSGIIARVVSADTTDAAEWGLGTSSSWAAVAVAYKSSTP